VGVVMIAWLYLLLGADGAMDMMDIGGGQGLWRRSGHPGTRRRFFSCGRS
jgi:hypothetical protein